MTFTRIFALGCTLLFAMTLCTAQTPVAPANYDETKVPRFAMPDALVTFDGRRVDTPELWNNVRRPELLAAFAEEMYGKLPLRLSDIKPLTPGYVDTNARIISDELVFDGKATRYHIEIRIIQEEMREANPGVHYVTGHIYKIDVLVYVPNNVQGGVPLFLGLNFQGNHTVSNDPGIPLGSVWQNRELVPATEETRGRQSDRWQIEKVIDRGYATATAYYQQIEPDFNGGRTHGFRWLIDQMDASDAANAIATWAWGLSLIRQELTQFHRELELNIDPDRIILHGHSRLGKAALWAGAVDERFAMVISNNSGSGGAALTRREFGETVHRINTSFPHWFNENFKKYNHDVNSLPFDQHELIALIAPRPVYIASAVEDRWADPRGEFLSGLHADPVYRLLGTDGIAGVTEMPGLNQPVGGTIGYHIRTGKHDVTEYDWEQWLNFADKHFR